MTDSATSASIEGLKKPNFKHPDCPQVFSLDGAEQAVHMAQEAGLIDPETANGRLAMINLRRLALSAAQEAFGGCSRQQVGLTTAESVYACPLPTGAVELFAFGNININEPAALQLSRQTNNGMGFKA